jgi:hypothetical protein
MGKEMYGHCLWNSNQKVAIPANTGALWRMLTKYSYYSEATQLVQYGAIDIEIPPSEDRYSESATKS